MLNAFSSFITGNSFDASSLNDNNVKELLELCSEQKITAMVLHSVLKSNHSLSSKKAGELKFIEYNRVSLQTNKNQKFLSVYNKMLQQGAKPVCVKGYILSSFYPSFDIRECSDEDLLVSEADFDKCKKILEENDFTFSSQGRNGYVQTYINKKSGCMIDLHRSLFPTDDVLYLSFNNLLEGAFDNSTEIDDNIMFTLPCELQLLYLILHSFKHFLYSGIGIRQVADFSLFCKSSQIKWNDIFDVCRAYNLTDFLSAIILISNKYFCLNIDDISAECFKKDIDYRELLDDILSGGVYGSSDEDEIRANNLIFKEYLNSINAENVNYLNILFPSANKMKSKYKYVEKHPVLLPVSYVNRIIDYTKSNNISKTIDNKNKRKELLKKYNIIK